MKGLLRGRVLRMERIPSSSGEYASSVSMTIGISNLEGAGVRGELVLVVRESDAEGVTFSDFVDVAIETKKAKK